MNRKRVALASSLAILMAPAVLGSIPTSTVSVHAAESGLTGTIRRGGNTLYDGNGNPILDSSLSNFTSWKLGSSFNKDGVIYYQVGNNEYAAADGMDIVGPDNKVQNNVATDSRLTLDNPVATIQQGGGTVYDINGNATGRTLSVGSAWKVLNPNVVIGGKSYYQVSGSEYIVSTGSSLIDASTSNNSNSSVSTQNKTVETLGYNSKVVDINGNDTGVTLPAGSSWQLGKLVSIQGNNYYKVATNEYVLAVAFKTTSDNSNNNSNVEVAKVDTTVTIGANETAIVNDSGVATGNHLSVGTSWKVDQIKVIGGFRYYRVANNQWVKRTYVPADNSVTITLIGNQKVYDTSTNSMTRSLPNGSSWKVSKVFGNSKNIYWGRVSSNEWVKISGENAEQGVSMSYGDSDSVPSIAIKEPSFALNF
ncbi:SLAP domain-containing protein [Companilactobacillus nodensis]|uniref:Teichoic acid-binding N-acetylmuramoyl L-alalanine amidase n=1 Tax=Companilactobacillus nodensis DSM 19682 = JCM 14932 = NBRC 107160 TaxID=1423775 RepID=A0A0R1KHR0_9LACO|nr:SLAP domain-containing protein [Companilactobacillus nodensis]KRK78551.1 teichoic acid-binding N-acetylmuramoyl L-alalanine amidase [Companilactobacillus nodensis DSM 19682 = JCM 14932 = NBRC 107160]